MRCREFQFHLIRHVASVRLAGLHGTAAPLCLPIYLVYLGEDAVCIKSRKVSGKVSQWWLTEVGVVLM